MTVVGCHQIPAQIAKFQHQLDFGMFCQNLACRNPASAAGFLQSDTKIRGPSTVDSGYQQAPIPGGGEFPQM